MTEVWDLVDSVKALQWLNRRYQSIIISNINNVNIERTVNGPLPCERGVAYLHHVNRVGIEKSHAAHL